MSKVSILFLFLGMTSGCAVLHPPDRPIANFMDDYLAPENETVQTVLIPVALPVGFISLVTDAVVVNPIKQIPDAYDIAKTPFTEIDYYPVAEIILFPMRIVTSVFLFVGGEITHCLFPIPSRKDSPPKGVQPPGPESAVGVQNINIKEEQ